MDIRADIRPKGSGITLIVLHGEIGTETVNQFKDQIDRVINDGNNRLIIDFQDVNYLNSIGLGVVAAALKRVKKNKGDLKIVKPSPAVQELFDLTRLTKVFEIYESEDEAVKSFG